VPTNNNESADNGTDSYQASRDKAEAEKHAANKETLKTGAKAAGIYFGGAAGGAAVDAASKTKIGNKILNKGADALDKNNKISRVNKKLNDSGILDAANAGMDVVSKNPEGAASKAGAKGAASGANGAASGASAANNKLGSGAGSNPGEDTAKESNLTKPGLRKHLRHNASDDSSDNDDDSASVNGKGPIPKIAILSALLFAIPIFIIMFGFFVIANEVGIMKFDDAFAVSNTAGENTGNQNYSSSGEQGKFSERVTAIKNSYQAQGKSFRALYVAAVYYVLNYHNSSINYASMTDDKIKEIFDAMFSGNSFSEDTLKNNLKNKIFPEYFPNASSTIIDNYVNEVFQYVKDYKRIIGENDSSGATGCSELGACTYNIKGYDFNGNNRTEAANASNIQVQLMQVGYHDKHDYGGTDGVPLENEELVPFEKYVLGVAYQEIGDGASIEAFKAQMLAARNYILARHKVMGGWRTFSNETGKWILKVASCTQDQVYCDPDKGCSADCYNGDCSVSYCCQWRLVHSGTSHGSVCRGAMPADSKYRTAAAETAGQIIVNNQGYVVSTDFGQIEQDEFEALAKQGLDYKQILLQVYGKDGATNVVSESCNTDGSSSCSSSGGDYTAWKQTNTTWGSTSLGNSSNTISSAGCLVTSISMLIAKSKVTTNVSGTFNPGTFVQKLNSVNAFDAYGNLSWNSVTEVAPTFKYVGDIQIAGQSKEQKLAAIKDLLAKGYYVVAEVKGNTGEHWVALDSVSGSSVKMFDPGSDATDLWTQYDWHNTSRLDYFKVG
jgi:hypothetical protein